MLRIGGDSADATWWPLRGAIPPGGASYRLTPGWLATTRALAQALGAHLIMGVNLAGNRPALAAAEARAILAGIGRRQIEALEIGNEPDLYANLPWYRDLQGGVFRARGRSYGLSSLHPGLLALARGACRRSRSPARPSRPQAGWGAWAACSPPSPRSAS